VTTTRRQAGTILGCLATANLLAYAARNSLFAVYPALRDRYGFHDAKLGLLATVFIIPHALATLPFGWAGDRIDRRWVICAGMLLASAAAAAGAWAPSFAWLSLSRALVGLGAAAVVPCANTILGQLFPGPEKARRMSVFNLGLFMGGVFGIGLGPFLHFPAIVLFFAVPGAALGVAICFLPIPEHADIDPSASMGDLSRAFLSDARVLLRIRTMRWIIASATAMAFAAGAMGAWLKEYLNRDKGMSDKEATTLLGVSLIGGLVGIIVGGQVADRVGKHLRNGRLWTMVVGMALTFPPAVASLYLDPGPGLYVTSILTLFFISSYHAPMAASVDDIAPADKTVAAQGLVIFTMHLLGTSTSSYLVGVLTDWSGSLRAALWLPISLLVIASVLMAVATRTFSSDVRRARSR
jgi:MFS family permease